MLTGELRSQVDQLWNAFWTCGISNPLEVIEQITSLLFARRDCSVATELMMASPHRVIRVKS